MMLPLEALATQCSTTVFNNALGVPFVEVHHIPTGYKLVGRDVNEILIRLDAILEEDMLAHVN